MSAYLMDYLVPTIRSQALRALCIAYKPSLPCAYLIKALGFAHYADANAELAKYLLSKGAKLDASRSKLLTKESALSLK